MNFDKLLKAAQSGDINGLTNGMNDLEKEMNKKINLKSEPVYFEKDGLFIKDKNDISFALKGEQDRSNYYIQVRFKNGDGVDLFNHTLEEVIDMIK